MHDQPKETEPCLPGGMRIFPEEEPSFTQDDSRKSYFSEDKAADTPTLSRKNSGRSSIPMSPVFRRKNSMNSQSRRAEPHLPEDEPAFRQANSRRSSIDRQLSRKSQPEDEPYFTAEDETSEVSLGNVLIIQLHI